MILLWDQFVPFALVVGLVVVLLKLLIRTKSNRGNTPPCIPWIPVLGSLPFIPKLETFGLQFMEESKKRGKVFAFYASDRYAVVLNGWETIHEAFVKKGLAFADRQQFHFEKTVSNPHLKGMLVHPYNEQFVKMRRTSMTLLKDLGYGRNYVETRIGVELDVLVDRIRKCDGRAFDPTDMLYQCNNGIIMSFMFGRQFDYDNDPLMQHVNVYVRAGTQAGPEIEFFPILRFVPKYKRQLNTVFTAQKNLFEVMDGYIKQCLRNDEDSFVNSYVKSFGPQYDAEQLQYLLRDLLIAGSETTMTSLLWSLIYLANYPEWQARLQNQIDDVLGHPTSGRKATLEDSRRLTYVEATILELMRIETVVPQSLPRRTLEDTEVSGFFIPKNTMVIPNLYGVHMDPDVWSEPSVFRPERFLDDNDCIVRKDRIMPFSVGKRSCFGEILARQELFLILTRLAHLFEIRPPEGQSRIDFTRFFGFTIRPLPYSVRLVPRTVNSPATGKVTSDKMLLTITDAN